MIGIEMRTLETKVHFNSSVRQRGVVPSEMLLTRRRCSLVLAPSDSPGVFGGSGWSEMGWWWGGWADGCGMMLSGCF